jgi:hypothetical protein
MYNQEIIRISPWTVFRVFFLSGTAFFGLGGLIIGIVEKDILGMLGGAFIGLVLALCSALGAAAYCAIFNLLAPVTGGIAVQIKPLEQQELDQDEANPSS